MMTASRNGPHSTQRERERLDHGQTREWRSDIGTSVRNSLECRYGWVGRAVVETPAGNNQDRLASTSTCCSSGIPRVNRPVRPFSYLVNDAFLLADQAQGCSTSHSRSVRRLWPAHAGRTAVPHRRGPWSQPDGDPLGDAWVPRSPRGPVYSRSGR